MADQHIMLGDDKITPRIDPQRCLKEFGGNRYQMIIWAAARAREIARKRNIRDKDSQKIHTHNYKPINEALKEIQEGKLKYGS